MMSRAGVITSQYRSPLAGHKFDGETTRQMGIAFEMALASLGATRRCKAPFVRRLRSASSRWRKRASAIPSGSVRAPCGRSALLLHSEGAA
jgi:hypothetical protein